MSGSAVGGRAAGNSDVTTRGDAAQAWPCDAWRGPLLVVRLSSLGDVVLATGIVDLIGAHRPDLTVDVLTRAPYAPVWRGHPVVRHVLLANAGGGSPGGHYGHVLDLQGGAKGRRAARTWAPGAPRTTYPRAALARRLLVLWGRRAAPVEPLVVRYARPVAGRAVDARSLAPRIVADPARVAILRAELEVRGGAGTTPARGWVLLAPGASRPLKAIPAPLIGDIATGLRARGWGTVLLEAPPPDPAAVPGWIGPSAGHSLAFRGPLTAVIDLLAAVDAVVASDSGILHLACALKRPVAALFGPTVPELGFAPLGRSRAVGADLPCRPCHVHGPAFCWLGHRRCWDDLTAADAIAALEELAGAG